MFAFNNLSISEDPDGNARILWPDNERVPGVTLLGVDAATLTESDFVFG